MKGSQYDQKLHVICQNVRSIRTSKNITMIHMAKATGLSQSYISRLECGEKNNITFNTLFKIAEALNVSIHDLLDGLEEKQFKQPYMKIIERSDEDE